MGFSRISGIFESELADGRDKLSQRSVDPVIIAVCSHVNSPFTQKTRLIVACFATGLTCDIFELFLNLFPVYYVPPIGDVFGSLVVVLEIVGMFPNIES